MVRTAQDVAAVVRNARAQQRLTQAQLADRARVGRDWVVRLEQGNPRLELAKVLDALAALGLALEVVEASAVDDDDPFAQVIEKLQ